MADPSPPKLPEVKRAPVPLELAPMQGQEQDALFKAQMALANFFLGFWKQGLAILGVGLVIAFAGGQYLTHVRTVQRDAQAAIARIDERMPQPDQMALMGLAPLDDPSDSDRMAKLEEGAKRYAQVAEGSTGTGAVTAWLRAAESWQRAGQDDKALAALRSAVALEGEGIVGWAASSGLATAQADGGDIDGAIATLRSWSDRGNDLLSQQALLRIGQLQESAGRADDARATYTDFMNRFADSPLRDTVQRAQGRLQANG